eukprot:TRINITY_DN7151_c0_g3_i1.p1 TRINITY_DN7151_c0_g3~~TRINITY_DN7151_c0_g3_i1.p1  ORF type:complete len:1065 (+),score=289.28 TRINITY_DN7151_c0_g3_i1:266-3196(+)
MPAAGSGFGYLVHPTTGERIAPHYVQLSETAKAAMRPSARVHGPIACAVDAVECLRGLPAHPSIIRLLEARHTTGQVTLLTESASTLRARLYDRGLTLSEMCTGLAAIARALFWLHREYRRAFNNVTLDGIYVVDRPGEGVSWVLGDFAFCTPSDAWETCRTSMAFQGVVAPEDCIEIPGSRPLLCGRDVYGLGCLMDQLLSALAEGHVAPGCSQDELAEIRRAAELRVSLLPQIVEIVPVRELSFCQVSIRAPSTMTTSTPQTVTKKFRESVEMRQSAPVSQNQSVSAMMPTPTAAQPCLPSPKAGSVAAGSSLPGADQGAPELAAPSASRPPPAPPPPPPPAAASTASAASPKPRKGGIGMLDDDDDDDDGGEAGDWVGGYGEHMMPPPQQLTCSEPPPPSDGAEEEEEYEEEEYDSDGEYTTEGHYVVDGLPPPVPHVVEDPSGTMMSSSSQAFQASSFAVAAARNRVMDSGLGGLGALLDEVAGEIDWLDDDALPEELSLVTGIPDNRPLGIGEELCLWSLAAQHRNPHLRSPLSALWEGRHLQAVTLVRAVHRLRAQLPASAQGRRECYEFVAAALTRVAHCDAVEWLVPALLGGQIWSDDCADSILPLVLRPAAESAANTPAATPTASAVHEGAFVEVHGLQKAPELNGQRGTVDSFDAEAGRWNVILESGEQRGFRPGNLRLIQPEAGPPPGAPRSDGILLAQEYEAIVAPFLRSCLRRKDDAPRWAALLRRMQLCAPAFEASELVQELLPSTTASAADSNDRVCAAACEASGALVGAIRGLQVKVLSHSPKAFAKQEAVVSKLLSELGVAVCKVAIAPHESVQLRAAAAAGLLGMLGADCGETAAQAGGLTTVCLHGLCTVLHATASALRVAVLNSIGEAMKSRVLRPKEAVGLLVPLLTPLTLATDSDVRAAAVASLSQTVAMLRSAGTRGHAYPPKGLPVPQLLLSSVPKSLREPLRRRPAAHRHT